MIKAIVNKHSVAICLAASVILMVIAAMKYPGGSLLDKNSVGFGWSKNFFSNLFEEKAINGSENPGRIWAIAGMAFHSVGYGLFFIHMSKKIASGRWAGVLRFIGILNIIFIFLIATPLHDIGVISIVLTLLGLFTVTVFLLKSRRHWLKFFCIACLLTYYGFFMCFGLGYLDASFVMQKIYVVSSMLLVIALEYFTGRDDFMELSGKSKQKRS
ncbi:DUF998 domain-containing protein [Flavobacterium longum]|uniref:hypothetical protein n=1 Tax=Flavobacterium longum TaxID=1299340 RepID=UPI0039E95C2F